MGDRQFAEALAGAQDGEEHAVSALWRAHNALLLRYLRTRHAARDVDDVASEVWLRVSRNWRMFHGDERDFRAWFFTIARATSVDWYRRSGRRPEVLAWDVETRGTNAHNDAEASAIESIGTDQAIALLARLPRDQAEVIALRVVAGLDAERVAELVGKKPGNVRVLQHRGLRTLAELMEREHTERSDVMDVIR
jgi:RNA polymerase sigma-70 factor (ECF subfamily)